jgi:acyl dehydratase
MEEIKLGYSFEKAKVFSERDLQKMASDCGDENFIHHDPIEAKETRFGGIIASGSAISAIFSAMIPTNISKISHMLGLEMSFKFKAPIMPGVKIIMRWEISEIQDKAEAGKIITLLGNITDIKGVVLVSGFAQVLLLSSL